MSARSALILALPCLACEMEQVPQPNRTQEHHLNLGGKAGQKRRGNAYSVPLCAWHHVAHAPNGMTKARATFLYGPSLAGHSKLFRSLYGSDDSLLAKTNAQLTVAA